MGRSGPPNRQADSARSRAACSMYVASPRTGGGSVTPSRGRGMSGSGTPPTRSRAAAAGRGEVGVPTPHDADRRVDHALEEHGLVERLEDAALEAGDDDQVL